MIVDMHTHVWPDRIAGRALSSNDLAMPVHGDGTARGLLASMETSGVDRAICLSVANTPERTDAANEFAGGLQAPLIGFGSVHAGSDPEETYQSLRRNGLRGVKVHPVYQDYRLDDPGLTAVLDALRGEFAAVIHVGGTHARTDDRCSPKMLRELAQRLPGLDIIACHFGGFNQLKEAADQVVGQPVYLDTSWPPSLAGLDRTRVRELIRRHGVERVLFASDWPMADPAAEIEAIRTLDLTDTEADAVLGGNAVQLLDLGEAPS